MREHLSEDKLDQAVRAILAEEPAMSDLKFDEARDQVLAGASAPAATGGNARRGQPRRRRLLAAAAAVAVMAAGGMVGVSLLGGDLQPVASAAAVQTLDRAADLSVNAHDLPLASGQYRYVVTRSWNSVGFGGNGKDCMYLREQLREVWIPANPDDEWLMRRTDATGNHKLITCSEQDVRPPERPQEYRARHGDFFGPVIGRENGSDITRPAEPSLDFPTPDFLAGLPRDPQQLYGLLRADAKGDTPDRYLFRRVHELLNTGMVPGDLRAALYRALTYLPGVYVTEQSTNLDGRQGTAIGLTTRDVREEIILDPVTGDYIGERQVQLDTDAYAPAGTTTGLTSVSTDVVDREGAVPAH